MYNLKKHLGSGLRGAVFLSDFNFEEIALKINFNIYENRSEPKNWAKTEYENLKILEGINGIPKPKLLDLGVEGYYHDLKLVQSGANLFELCSDLMASGAGMPYFSGAFGMEYFPDAKRITSTNDKYASEYFDDLERLVNDVKSLGYELPFDCDVFTSNGKPCILDWHHLEPKNSKWAINGIEFVDGLRDRYSL